MAWVWYLQPPIPPIGSGITVDQQERRPFGPRARSKFPILSRLSLPPSNTRREISRSRAALHLQLIVYCSLSTMPLQNEIHTIERPRLYLCDLLILILEGIKLDLKTSTRK